MGVNDKDDIAAREEPVVERELNPIKDEVIETESTLDMVMQDKPEPADQGIDDILTSDGERPPSKFEELQDLLSEVRDKNDYKQIAPSVSEAYKSGQLTDEEHKNLLKICESLYQALKEE